MARWSRAGVRRRLGATVALGGLVAGLVVVAGAPAGATGQPPVAVADTYAAASGQERYVPFTRGVLINDADPEGDGLTASIVTGASNGQLSLKPDGGFTYEPDADFVGTDTFAYRASDGTELSETVLVSIVVRSPMQAFVTALYRDFLGREPDPAGLQFWSSRIERRVESRAAVAHRMSRSHEYAVKVVDRMYRDVLDRAVDPSGRAYWAKRIADGMSPSTLLLQLIGSNEFFVRSGGTPGGFVDAVYAGILDRAPTGTERAAQVAGIESGTRRLSIVAQLYRGLESRTRRVRVQFQDLLEREPTSEELVEGRYKLTTLDDRQLAVWIATSYAYLIQSYTE